MRRERGILLRAGLPRRSHGGFPENGKAYCRATNECWDCMSCVKACPCGALETRIPYQLGYYKATLRPIMGKDSITWKCRDIHGRESVYKYVNRLR